MSFLIQLRMLTKCTVATITLVRHDFPIMSLCQLLTLLPFMCLETFFRFNCSIAFPETKLRLTCL